MSFKIIYCPGGAKSQTGIASKTRYQEIQIKNCGKLEDIPEELEKQRGTDPFVTPVWNSNQGEIPKCSYVWDLVTEDAIKILDLWPKKIEFMCLVRCDFTPPLNRVGSVIVAETQCSKFIKNHSVDFKHYPLTPDAFDAFSEDKDDLDGVLVPTENDYSQFNIFDEKAENANNFTSFITIAKCHSLENPIESNFSLTGVTMQSLSGETIDESQRAFFDGILENCESFDDIPSLIFVFNRSNTIGLLFEGKAFSAGDFLTSEEIETEDVTVHEEAGIMTNSYTRELNTLISSSFPQLNEYDFFEHKGHDTYLFACPPLSVYIHGFDSKSVKPIVIFYLNLLFQFVSTNQNNCSQEQGSFIAKHSSEWNEKGLLFFEEQFNKSLIT